MGRCAKLAGIVCLSLVNLACSGSDSDAANGASFATTFPAFEQYCTGVLKVGVKLMRPDGSQAWHGDSSTGSAPAGTHILLGRDFGRWEGYVLTTDLIPMKLNPGFQNELVKDVDFVSDCSEGNTKREVLLADSTFHASEDLSGDPCMLPAGTALTSYGFVNGEPASVHASEISSICGIDAAYSTDILTGSLLLKQ